VLMAVLVHVFVRLGRHGGLLARWVK